MNTIPEAPETIEAQMEWLRAGKRRAVLLTPGTPMPGLPEWSGMILLKEGLLIFDARKEQRSALMNEIECALGGLGTLLGYGIDRKPAGESPQVVTIRNHSGREKQAVFTDEENLAAVMKAAHGIKDPTDTVHRENGQQVIADRLRCLDARELKVRPYHAESDALALAAAAKADNHVPLNPTHVIERDGEIVGYFGVNSLPLYRLWFHSEKMSASASTRLLFMIENHFRMAGVGIVGTVINTNSPFYPVAARGGYLECSGDRLFLKGL